MYALGASEVLAENEVGGADQAESGPEVVPGEFFFEVPDGEGDKHGQCEDFLEDLELADAHDLMTDAIGGDLNQVFEKCDAPTDQGGDQPGLCRQVLEVPVPGEGHEQVAEKEQKDSGGIRLHGELVCDVNWVFFRSKCGARGSLSGRIKLFKRGILIASMVGGIICFPDVDGGGGVF